MEQLAGVLDPRTIFLVSMIITFICALLVFQLWRQNRQRFAGIGYLALNYAIQVTGLLLLVTRGIIPDFISVIVSNGLMAAGIAIGYYGFTLFCGKPRRMGF